MIWLFFFPVYRFGSGYILFLILLIFVAFIFNKKPFIKRLKLVIAILCIVIVGKNINRIIKNYNIYEYQLANLSSLPQVKIKIKKLCTILLVNFFQHILLIATTQKIFVPHGI